MQIFVVSMHDSSIRRQHITDEFGKQGLSWIFFDALNHQQGLAKAAQIGVEIREDLLSGSEIGCFMSHVAIWQQVVESKTAYAAVFEDDVYLGGDADKYLNHEQWLAGIGGLVKLETMLVPCLLAKKVKKIDANRQLQRLYSCHWGTAGYIVSYAVAQKLLTYVQRRTALAPIDDLMFEYFRKETATPIYQMVPAISIQDKVLHEHNQKFDSLVEDERTEKRRNTDNQRRLPEKTKLGLHQKAARELKRLQRQCSPDNIKRVTAQKLAPRSEETVAFK